MAKHDISIYVETRKDSIRIQQLMGFLDDEYCEFHTCNNTHTDGIIFICRREWIGRFENHDFIILIFEKMLIKFR